MKMASHNSFLFVLIVVAIISAACSANDQKTQQKNEKPAAASNTEKVISSASDCCFTSAEDFKPFIPPGNATLTVFGNKGFSANFFCDKDDDPKRTAATQKYQIDKEKTSDPMMAKFLTLQLMDYCSNPEYLANDQKRRRENSGKAAEKNTKISLNDIKKDGAYYGYTWVDSSPGNNAQNVHVYVVVDNRFRIHIQGIDHVRLDAAQQLLDMIPVETLAKVGK